jgi:hypothetical protein
VRVIILIIRIMMRKCHDNNNFLRMPVTRFEPESELNVQSGLQLDYLAGGYYLFNHTGTYGPFVCLRKEYKHKATSDVIIISPYIRPYSD